MLRKIKKIFFPSIFGILYISFVAQLIHILVCISDINTKFIALAVLSLEWMIIIIARYFSKKAGGNSNFNNYNGRRR